MKYRYELSNDLLEKVQRLEEFANGASQVTIVLRDGRKFADVLLSDGRFVIAVRGYSDMPFAVEEIARVFQTEDDRNPRARSGWEFWDDWEAS